MGAPRPRTSRDPGAWPAAYGLSLRQRGQPNRARYSVTTDGSAPFWGYVDLTLSDHAPELPNMAQGRGRRWTKSLSRKIAQPLSTEYWSHYRSKPMFSNGDRGSSKYEIVLKACNECVLKGQRIAPTEIYNDVRTNLRRLRHHISERTDLGETG